MNAELKQQTAQQTARKPNTIALACRAARDVRDAEAIYQALVEDNERRKARGLPTFEPSYLLAYKILRQ